MPQPIVVIEGVHKTFVHMGRPLHVLKGVDLTIEQGEIVAIVGKSGAARAPCSTASALDVLTRAHRARTTSPASLRQARRDPNRTSGLCSSSTTSCRSSPRWRT
jgi:ABC-type glutathione transport system ATPase component